MSDHRFAEGTRAAAECQWCSSPYWIVYHGPQANHTCERFICGAITPSGPTGKPLACAFSHGHSGSHSWADLATRHGGAEGTR